MYYVRKSILNTFDLINDLRLHVLLNYFLTVSWLLYASHASAADSVEFAFIVTSLAGFAYLLNRYTDYPYDLIVDKGQKKCKRIVYLYLSFFFLFLTLFSFYQSVLPLLSFYLVTTVLSAGIIFGYMYSVKTFFSFPLKNYFIIKNLTSVTAKCIAFILGAILLTPADPLSLATILLSVFSVHLIYELLWDIRDIESDKAGKVETLPTRFGKHATLIACLIVWLCSITAITFLGDPNSRFFIKYLLMLMFVLLTFFISRPRYFHLMIYAHLLLNLTFVNKEVVFYLHQLVSA